jgi:GH35 family endo-1,4-beta-xylanase
MIFKRTSSHWTIGKQHLNTSIFQNYIMKIVIFVITLILLSSCTSPVDPWPEDPKTEYDFIVNTNVDATISILDSNNNLVNTKDTVSLKADFKLEEGTYTIQAKSEGFHDKSLDVNIPTQTNINIPLEINRFHKLSFGIGASRPFLIGSAPEWDLEQYRKYLMTDLIVITQGARLDNLRLDGINAPIRWDSLDQQIDYLESHNKKIKIHYLWNGVSSVIPNDFWSLSETDRKEWMLGHARMIAERYKGRIAMYDVVNHPVRDGDDINYLGTGLTKVEAIDILFRQTKEIDPDAILVLNEGGIIIDNSIIWPINKGKDNDYYALLEKLVSIGTPIDCIGFMSHAIHGNFDEIRAKQVLDRFSAFNIPLCITEFDLMVPDDTIAYNPESEWWQEQGIIYQKAYELFNNHPSVKSIITWELSDGFTWRPGAALLTYNDPRLNLVNDAFIRQNTRQRIIEIEFTINNSNSRMVLYEEGGQQRGISIYLDSGIINAYIWNDAADGPTFEPLHLSAQLSDASKVKFVHESGKNTGLYLNNELVDSGTALGLYPRTGLTIGGADRTRFHDGAFGEWGYHFVGSLSSVIVWDTIDSSQIPVVNLTFENLDGFNCNQCPRLEDGNAIFEDYRHLPKPAYNAFEHYAEMSK